MRERAPGKAENVSMLAEKNEQIICNRLISCRNSLFNEYVKAVKRLLASAYGENGGKSRKQRKIIARCWAMGRSWLAEKSQSWLSVRRRGIKEIGQLAKAHRPSASSAGKPAAVARCDKRRCGVKMSRRYGGPRACRDGRRPHILKKPGEKMFKHSEVEAE